MAERLEAFGGRHVVESSPLHPDEAADRIALHLGRLLRQTVNALEPRQRASLGVALAREIVVLLEAKDGSGVEAADRPLEAATVLRALLGHRPDGLPATLTLPVTPLLDTTLLTNAPGEPRVGHQLRTEIPSADRIDVLMAFVRQTGIRPMLDLLRQHREQGRRLRVLTTTYTGSTELAALQALHDLGAEIRVSYDTSGTRLHAKAWLFHRASGYSTAYIGSSNLTHSAQVTGLEWNVRVAGARNPDVIEKFAAVFESYWCHDDFRPFDASEFLELTRSSVAGGPRVYLSPVELRPEPFQSRLLELVALSRIQGRHRNLLVAATGTGKTVMAALDYQRLRAQLPRAPVVRCPSKGNPGAELGYLPPRLA
nr:phospholipase D-like domain-containing protein [Thermomonas sp.]